MLGIFTNCQGASSEAPFPSATRTRPPPLPPHRTVLFLRSRIWGSRRMVQSRSRRTSFVNRAFAVLGALVWIFQANAGHAQAANERWAASGTIAGQPATFILDTGAQPPFAITAADSRRSAWKSTG